jgi:hypothetical protein
MTTLELIDFLEYLQKTGHLNKFDDVSLTAIVLDYLKQANKPEWTDRLFPPSTPEK